MPISTLALPQEVTFPEEWEKILKETVERKGVVFILGATDSGKTTLAKCIIQRKVKNSIHVAFIDSDVGQSTLGPPGAISMAIVRENYIPIERLLPLSMRFIGAVSPSGHLLEMVTGVKYLLDKAKSFGIEDIVVDTTGMVYGEEGKALKINKINLVKPDIVIAIEKENELEDILKILKVQGNIRILHLTPSLWINIKSREERRKLRQQKFKNYFEGATLQSIPIRSVVPYRIYPTNFQGLILGLLNRELETVGLGVGSVWDEKTFEILTPLKSLEDVKIIEGGFLKIDTEKWEEMVIF